MDSVIAHVGDIDYIVGCGRVLKSIHPLLGIVGVASPADSVDAGTDVRQPAQRPSTDRHDAARNRPAHPTCRRSPALVRRPASTPRAPSARPPAPAHPP